jgi:hypothetical protein
MAIFYKQAFHAVLQRLLASIEQSFRISEQAASDIPTDIVSLSGDALEAFSGSLDAEEAALALDWRAYVADVMGPDSLWPTKPEQLSASFAVSTHLTPSFVKRGHVPRSPAVDGHSALAIFACQARRVQFAGSTQCRVSIERTRVVIELPRRTRELALAGLRSITPKTMRERPSLLEFVSADGRVILLDFQPSLRGKFLQTLGLVGARVTRVEHELKQLCIDWSSRRLTAFTFLIRLNSLMGRSLANRESYPVFPMPIIGNGLRDFRKSPACDFDPAVWPLFSSLFTLRLAQTLPAPAFTTRFAGPCELSIEFFCAFEFFAGLPLPSFAKDEFEFVYFLRGALESDAVAGALHLWTEALFHAGAPRDPPPPLPQDRTVALPSFCIGAYAWGIFAVANEPTALFHVAWSGVASASQLPFAVASLHAVAGGLVAFDASGRRIAVATAAGEPFRETALEFTVADVCNCGELLAVRTAAGEIAVLRLSTVLAVLRIASDTPIATYASAEYNHVIVGTADGRLLFFALHSGRVLMAASLDGRPPLRIVVAQGFGFVIVALPGRLALFTVNGTKIRERDFAGAIITWSPFLNRRGFDFVVVATADGSVAIMEAFTLELRPPMFRSRRAPTLLASANNAFVVATEDGQAHEIPCDPIETTVKFD